MAHTMNNTVKDNAHYLDKLCEELRLRKYSKQTENAYLNIIKNFLVIKIFKQPRFILMLQTKI